MTMRIGANYPQGSAATDTAKKSAEATAGRSSETSAGKEAPDASAVKVTWSAKAQELGQAQAPESSEKVQRLQAAVESNQLQIDPEKIAAAIVGE
jgi:anti-sigma28 factor (negative regulator of flagellin synthesis)